MTGVGTIGARTPVHGFVDHAGRLVAADPELAALHARAGGAPGTPLAVPQLATLARLAKRLGIVVSRGVVAADGEQDLDLWVRAAPEGEGIHLAVVGWSERPPLLASATGDRGHDIARALADWQWEADAALRLTALSAGAPATGGLLGQPLTRLFAFLPAADGSVAIVEALAEQRGFDDQQAEIRLLPEGGRWRLTATPLIGSDGRFAGFSGTAHRIDPATVADETRESEDAFAGLLGDALRAPLDRIIAQAETIRLQGEGPIRPDYADYAADIASAGRHLLALVSDLVDLAAVEREDFRPEAERIDLGDLATQAAGLLVLRATAGGVRVDRMASDGRLAAIGDYRRALQILVNLIGNAIRYSPEGGMVWIRGDRQADRVRLTIADQGRGIASEDQARIFEKFERVDPSEPGTTGLGLYIARRLARAMRGELTVESAPGQGARFTLTLPAAD